MTDDLEELRQFLQNDRIDQQWATQMLRFAEEDLAFLKALITWKRLHDDPEFVEMYNQRVKTLNDDKE